MPTFSWMFVIIILSSTEGTTFFKRQNKKCEAVVMCPQFCLKIKDECYICECKKSMNSFMQGAIQQMKHDYDPIYQTGSKFVNLNMGTKDETNKIQEQNPNIRKSPWINMGNFEANTFGGVMMGGVESVSQTGHYLEPNFKEFYKPVAMVLPGRCPEMSYACPGRCWKTDGFSGCFRCECEVNTIAALILSNHNYCVIWRANNFQRTNPNTESDIGTNDETNCYVIN
uniref:Uncharacterized protein n=1 Tax=Magallana gigas TaxID=29159 RepID=K1R985_MAGGI